MYQLSPECVLGAFWASLLPSLSPYKACGGEGIAQGQGRVRAWGPPNSAPAASAGLRAVLRISGPASSAFR